VFEKMKWEITGKADELRPLVEKFVSETNKELDAIGTVEKMGIKVDVTAFKLVWYENEGKFYVVLPVKLPPLLRLVAGKGLRKAEEQMRGFFKTHGVQVEIKRVKE
jgi:hypothetical protein